MPLMHTLNCQKQSCIIKNDTKVHHYEIPHFLLAVGNLENNV
jgi:hypothetical protein